MQDVQAWAAVLDEIEERIASTEAALDADDILLDRFNTTFTPPQDLGPLPAELQARAEDVLQRQSETERRIGEAIEAVKRDIAKATRQRGSSDKANTYRDAPTAQFFDSNI